MNGCRLFLDEHTAGVCLLDRDHQVALNNRRGGAAAWSNIERRPARDYLDGQPIHCGARLELQHVSFLADDWGEYTHRLELGTSVRYELDAQKRIVLYVGVGGFEFATSWFPSMGLRWPRGRA